MKPLISSAGPPHGPLLARLHGNCFAEPWSDIDFAQLLAMPGAFAKLARLVDGKEKDPVGFAVVRAAGGECEIITIGVTPSYRGQGVGGHLIAAIAADHTEFAFDGIFLKSPKTTARRLIFTGQSVSKTWGGEKTTIAVAAEARAAAGTPS